VGVGLSSGNSYSFAERGPETVVPGVGAMAGGSVDRAPDTIVSGVGAMGGGERTIVEHVHRHTITFEGKGLMAGIRREVQIGGGDVQSVLGSGRHWLSRDRARQARPWG
ncbi:hypothetical protein, partial [Verrucosispora sp. NA02020]|uniref:hypothetical protein n=1 Tax=Verrucosispora sp. NA02020 TaxID=2742132 RepID=UPI003D714C21